MKNKKLYQDYILRAEKRLLAVQTLRQEESWADAVRESQEVVELALKSLLRFSNVEIPRIHDVSPILKEELSQLPTSIKKHVPKLCQISKNLRRDRELAFYGSEDLTPSEFYTEEDAKEAFDGAQTVVKLIKATLSKKTS